MDTWHNVTILKDCILLEVSAVEGEHTVKYSKRFYEEPDALWFDSIKEDLREHARAGVEWLKSPEGIKWREQNQCAIAA